MTLSESVQTLPDEIAMNITMKYTYENSHGFPYEFKLFMSTAPISIQSHEILMCIISISWPLERKIHGIP